MTDVEKTQWASAKINDDFICVETYSGYRLTKLDPKGVQHLAKIEIVDHELGLLVIDAISRSRFVLSQPRKDIFIPPDVTYDAEIYDYQLSSDRYHIWISKLMSAYSYKSKQMLFKNMKSCDIESKNGQIIFSPTCHEKLDAWSGKGIKPTDLVTLPSDSSPAEIGAALRLAFSRCIG